MEERFESSKTIDGTLKLHCFIPVNGGNTEVLTKVYSFEEHGKKATVSDFVEREVMSWQFSTAYVTCVYGEKWWLAYLFDKMDDTNEVKVKFLHPAGPALSFTYPFPDDILTLPIDHILSIVNPRTATGRTYHLTEQEMNRASKLLNTIG